MKAGTIYNIIGVYHLADVKDKAEGLKAYEMYNHTMLLFSNWSGMPIARVAGIFAALSPINDYKGNLRSLKTVLEASDVGILNHPSRIVVTTTHPNKEKAIAIAKGADPLDVLKSDKVRNFYLNISNPKNPDAVTIDRHAISVWQGFRDKEGRVPNYDRVAKDYRAAAKILGIIPNQLQGTTWFAWKRLHGISYDPQMGLFDMPENVWKSITRPSEITAFPFRKPGEKSKFKGKPKFGVCRVCGCTDNDCSECVEVTGEACHWVDKSHTLCSRCAPAPAMREKGSFLL